MWEECGTRNANSMEAATGVLRNKGRAAESAIVAKAATTTSFCRLVTARTDVCRYLRCREGRTLEMTHAIYYDSRPARCSEDEPAQHLTPRIAYIMYLRYSGVAPR